MSNNFQRIKAVVIIAWLGCIIALLVSYFVSQTNISTAQTKEKSIAKIEEVKEISGYKSWTKVNPKPLQLPTPLDILCRIPTGTDLIQTSSNPHRQWQKYFTVYVNDIGRNAMLNEKTPKFPVGSVIVKEKLLSEDSTAPELLTVMIKQKKGFNPTTGDWEYMVVNGAGTKVEGRGNLENCQSCHILNKQTDYIFRSYLPEKEKGELK
jgi:hypothetical protein